MTSGTMGDFFPFSVFSFLLSSLLHAYTGKSGKYIKLERATLKTWACFLAVSLPFPPSELRSYCAPVVSYSNKRGKLPYHKYIPIVFKTFKCISSCVYTIICLAIFLMLYLRLLLMFIIPQHWILCCVNISISKDWNSRK